MKPLIDRQEFPELDLIMWDNAQRYVSRREAFAIYEQRWSYLNPDKLTPAEKNLIAELTKECGRGLFLSA